MRRPGSEDAVQMPRWAVCTVLLFLAAAFVIYDFFFSTRPAPPRSTRTVPRPMSEPNQTQLPDRTWPAPAQTACTIFNVYHLASTWWAAPRARHSFKLLVRLKKHVPTRAPHLNPAISTERRLLLNEKCAATAYQPAPSGYSLLQVGWCQSDSPTRTG